MYPFTVSITFEMKKKIDENVLVNRVLDEISKYNFSKSINIDSRMVNNGIVNGLRYFTSYDKSYLLAVSFIDIKILSQSESNIKLECKISFLRLILFLMPMTVFFSLSIFQSVDVMVRLLLMTWVFLLNSVMLKAIIRIRKIIYNALSSFVSGSDIKISRVSLFKI